MVSCDLASDFVLSAILSSQFQSARKLCEIFYFENKRIFSFLYALSNLALPDHDLTKNIISSIAFSEGFAQQTKLAQKAGLVLPPINFDLNFEPEKYIQLLKSGINDENSQLRKFLANCINKFRSVAEIELVLLEFDSLVDTIQNTCSDELLNMTVVEPKFVGSPALDLSIARTFLMRAEYCRAKIHYELAFSLNPYNCSGFDQYSTVLWHLNEKDLLFSLFLNSKIRFRYSYQYQIVKGNFYSLTGANEKAIYSFRRAFEIDNRASYSLFLEGHDWLSLNNIEEAENAFGKLLNIDGDSYMAYFGLGIVNYKRKKYEKALSFLQVAKKMNPYNINIVCYCSIAYESLGRKSEALDVLKEELRNSTSIIYYRKAKLYESLNLIKESELTLKEAIQQFPNDPALYFSLAEIYNSVGQPSSAIKLLKRANELELNTSLAKEFICNIGI